MTSTSMIISGNTIVHQHAENYIQKFKQYDARSLIKNLCEIQ